MSSINRSLAGPLLTFDLEQQRSELQREEAYQRSGRASRTLVKSGRLRVVMTAVAKGALIGTHQADSPITVHVLQGHISYRTDRTQDLRAGQLLFFGPGDANDITAIEDSLLLLTISARGDDYLMEDPSDRPQQGQEGESRDR